MSGRYRLIVWIALADFFTVFSLATFALYSSQRARLNQIQNTITFDNQVRELAESLAERLRHYGLQVGDPGPNMAINLPEVLLFDSGQFTIKDPSNLAKIALALKDVRRKWNRNFILVVRGHTDSRPPRTRLLYRDNQELSEFRARAVEKSLVGSGIGPPEFQIVAQGLGEAEPLVPNCRNGIRIVCGAPGNFLDSDQLGKNRRIELRFGVFSGNASTGMP